MCKHSKAFVLSVSLNSLKTPIGVAPVSLLLPVARGPGFYNKGAHWKVGTGGWSQNLAQKLGRGTIVLEVGPRGLSGSLVQEEGNAGGFLWKCLKESGRRVRKI